MPTPESLQAKYSSRWKNAIISRPWHELSTLHAGLGTIAVLFPKCREQLEEMLATCHQDGISILPLGSGTNFIGLDTPSDFFALSLSKCAEARSFTHIGNGFFQCGTGLNYSSLLTQLAHGGWGGAAALSGIPGTLGGALAMNAGANGMETAQLVNTLQGYDLTTGQAWHWTPRDGGWNYRTSPVKTNILVFSAELKFCQVNPAKESEAIAAEKARRAKVTPKGASCGSIFRNPPAQAAGVLLEQSGCKGMACGPFQVSLQHANWIVNLTRTPGAASDCLKLANQMADKVRKNTGIDLHFELRHAHHGACLSCSEAPIASGQSFRTY